MYAQVVRFDGPRSPELVAANERAGRERLTPAVLADPDVVAAHVATYILRAPDGGELVVIISDTEAALDRGSAIIQSTELLPGEDPALLTEPDHIGRYAVVHAVDHGKVVIP
jgi:hypothetical protein